MGLAEARRAVAAATAESFKGSPYVMARDSARKSLLLAGTFGATKENDYAGELNFIMCSADGGIEQIGFTSFPTTHVANIRGLAIQPDQKAIVLGTDRPRGARILPLDKRRGSRSEPRAKEDTPFIARFDTFPWRQNAKVMFELDRLWSTTVKEGISFGGNSFFNREESVCSFMADSRFNTNVATALRQLGAPPVFYISALLLQPNLKLVAGGEFSHGAGSQDFLLIRFNQDGTLDRSFGGASSQGLVLTSFAGGLSSIRALTEGPDGEIIAVGGTRRPSGQVRAAIARYDKDGTPDSSFGVHGRIMSEFSKTDSLAVACTSDVDDGNLLIGGYAYVGSVQYPALAMYTNTGELANSFGDGGVRIILSNFHQVYCAVTNLYTWSSNLPMLAIAGIGPHSGAFYFDRNGMVSRVLTDFNRRSFGWPGGLAYQLDLEIEHLIPEEGPTASPAGAAATASPVAKTVTSAPNPHKGKSAEQLAWEATAEHEKRMGDSAFMMGL